MARSVDGLVINRIAEIRIAAKQAQGQAFESKTLPPDETLSIVAKIERDGSSAFRGVFVGGRF